MWWILYVRLGRPGAVDGSGAEDIELIPAWKDAERFVVGEVFPLLPW